MEIRGGVTRRDDDERTTNKQWKIELLSLWAVGRLSFAIIEIRKNTETKSGKILRIQKNTPAESGKILWEIRKNT